MRAADVHFDMEASSAAVQRVMQKPAAVPWRTELEGVERKLRDGSIDSVRSLWDALSAVRRAIPVDNPDEKVLASQLPGLLASVVILSIKKEYLMNLEVLKVIDPIVILWVLNAQLATDPGVVAALRAVMLGRTRGPMPAMEPVVHQMMRYMKGEEATAVHDATAESVFMATDTDGLQAISQACNLATDPGVQAAIQLAGGPPAGGGNGPVFRLVLHPKGPKKVVRTITGTAAVMNGVPQNRRLFIVELVG
jgi:hypothetical protein